MRFHLIDRVDGYEPGASVRARKLASAAETFWEESRDGPEMPPPLVLEALCQAATWLVIIGSEGRRRAALLSIASVSFLAPVRPGDVVLLEATVDSMTDETAVLSGRATVEGATVLEATEVMCTLIDAADLEAPDATRRMQELLTR